MFIVFYMFLFSFVFGVLYPLQVPKKAVNRLINSFLLFTGAIAGYFITSMMALPKLSTISLATMP